MSNSISKETDLKETLQSIDGTLKRMEELILKLSVANTDIIIGKLTDLVGEATENL